MVIAKSTLRQDIFSKVYQEVNTVSDPLSRTKQWIFSTLPDFEVNFVGFPIVIIKKANINKDYELFDNSFSDHTTPITITVYATSNALLDEISDDIDVVMIPSNFLQFRFYDYSETDGTTELGGQKVYFRTMNYFVEVCNL